MKTFNIGLMGLGTIGGGVVKLLHENGELIARRTGIKLRLRAVADRITERFKTLPLPADAIRSADAKEIAVHPEVDVVIELMGGYEPARTFALAALGAGKSVVTANKAMLAKHGAELFAAAEKSGAEVGFEASVCGTIPIIRVLRHSLAANRVKEVIGILNGTCNYILTKMSEEGLDFGTALKQAQAAGFAEADPTLDVQGEDAAHKLSILASLAFGIAAPRDRIHVEGITRVAKEDIQYAREFGYVIKLLGIARETDGEVELRVHPALISTKHPLAMVRNEFNAVFVRCDAAKETMYYGRGAGEMPTASAVVADVIEIGQARGAGSPAAGTEKRPGLLALFTGREKPIRALEKTRSRYYLRFPAIEKPGVVGIITSILGQKDVSIAAVHQNPARAGSEPEVEILTHEANEGQIREAMAIIEKNPVLRDKGMVLRVEE